MRPNPYLTQLCELFNANCKGSSSRCPIYIVLSAKDYAEYDRERWEWFEDLPVHLRFVTRQPMFKGAYVFGYGTIGNGPIFIGKP